MNQSGGFGGDGAHSATGSSGSFENHRERERYDPPYYNSFVSPPYSIQQSSPSQQTSATPKQKRMCCSVAPLAVLTLASLGSLFGIYSSTNMEAGLGYSRVVKANWLFVREIEVQQYEGSEGAYVYSFRNRPSLKDHADVSYGYESWLDGQRHQEWALWMNKGSRMTIHYDVKTRNRGIIFAVLKGEESFRRWLEDPAEYRTSLYWDRLRGGGKLQFGVDEGDDYYFAFGNTGYHPVEVSLRLEASLKLYSTDGYDSRCSLSSGACKVKPPSFALIATPTKTPYHAELWRFTTLYRTQWATYVVAYALVIGGLVLAWRFFVTGASDKTNEDAPPLEKKNEEAPLMAPESQTEDMSQNSEARLCAICMDVEKDSFFDPCGHSATCYPCGLRIKESANSLCPICRESIRAVRRLFRS